MARKNLIGISMDDNPTAEASAPMTAARPIAGFVSPVARSAVPVGGITKTLGNITQKFERAQDLERQLAEGQTVVDIDPALVDGSFVSDRLGVDAAELAQLVEQIRDHGQQVPILVRPNPGAMGRFQVAYGHRRLAAVKELGIKVRAVVRELSDDQLVVSQGQENNARTNLSYIERALFAVRLEDRSFSRDTIMAALGVDKAALSKMISVVRQIPIELIEAIGAAPEIGRRRWMELADLLPKGKVSELLAILSQAQATALSSDGRFQAVVDALTRKPQQTKNARQARSWAAADKSVSVTSKAAGKGYTLALKSTDAATFGEFITEQLDDLYTAFRNSGTKATGD
ncbi:plasmid partitioning protein RepB [Pseudaminobacter sp. NGMCC 1.201702]|uniref:plasmid partitioning protein RepB n=1 Tax=Pseudaminobacter sp. NGMCC 1.201702 TaxID=3391825 RepID=UPI0039F02A80